MKALFLEIKNRLTADIPTLSVHLFNDQFTKADTERVEKAIKYPVCYIEFITEEVANYNSRIKSYLMRIRFRFGVESYKFERLETFDFVDEFYQSIHMMAPTDRDTLNFTSFQEYQPEFDEDHKNVDRPYVDYRTRVVSRVAYRDPVMVDGVDLDLGIDIEHNPNFYESNELHPVYFYEEEELNPVHFGE